MGDPRQMSMMMKKLGIDVQDIPNVERVVISTPDKEYVFTEAAVSVMKAQGVETWQLSGTPEVREPGSDTTAPAGPVINEDDVKMIMDQTGADEGEVRSALESADGDLAQAILDLTAEG